jgi:hypothetical protein
MNECCRKRKPAADVRLIDILDTYWFIEAFLVYDLR